MNIKSAALQEMNILILLLADMIVVSLTCIFEMVLGSRNFCAAGQSIFLKPVPALTIYILCNV
jgi:hypothetical protein